MRLITKRIRLIEMTTEEIKAFQAMVEKAAQGQTVHAAETRLSDGTFLAVAINDAPTSEPDPKFGHDPRIKVRSDSPVRTAKAW